MNDENINNEIEVGVGLGLSSPTIGNLALALSKAQGLTQPAKKDKENPFFKSTYADLASVWDVIKKPFSDNELSIVQSSLVKGGNLYLITILSHSSGEWIKSTYPIKPTKDDPQGVGSAITYARRYALAAIAGVCTEDDDGNSASGNHERPNFSPKASEQLPASRQQGYSKPSTPKGSSNSNDWSKYSVRYDISFKTKEYNAKSEMENLKRLGFKFNPNDKLWYGSTPIPHLAKWEKPLVGTENKGPVQQSIPQEMLDVPMPNEPYDIGEDDIPF